MKCLNLDKVCYYYCYSSTAFTGNRQYLFYVYLLNVGLHCIVNKTHSKMTVVSWTTCLMTINNVAAWQKRKKSKWRMDFELFFFFANDLLQFSKCLIFWIVCVNMNIDKNLTATSRFILFAPKKEEKNHLHLHILFLHHNTMSPIILLHPFANRTNIWHKKHFKWSISPVIITITTHSAQCPDCPDCCSQVLTSTLNHQRL